jgi:hypothetical protein
MPKNCYGKNRLQRFYGFVAASKYLDFSEIGIAARARWRLAKLP